MGEKLVLLCLRANTVHRDLRFAAQFQKVGLPWELLELVV